MLIQWIEDPPTWDVLPTEKIMNGRCEIGGLCDVQYKEESSPAKILNVGKYVFVICLCITVINLMHVVIIIIYNFRN